jgi:hypothetical protein
MRTLKADDRGPRPAPELGVDHEVLAEDVQLLLKHPDRLVDVA